MSIRLGRSLLAATSVLMLTACPGGLTPGPTAPPSAITGTLTKYGAPLPDGTVVLLSRVGNAYNDREIKTTTRIGSYSFENVPPGTYRVAFDRATPAERRNPSQALVQQPGVDTYGFFSTQPFDLAAGQTRQMPAIDVGWAPNLQPIPGGTASVPVRFSWAAAPGATSYKVRIANAQNNTIYTSPSLSAGTTSYTWDGKLTDGSTARAGTTYYWSVNVDTLDGFGGTNISAFTLQ